MTAANTNINSQPFLNTHSAKQMTGVSLAVNNDSLFVKGFGINTKQLDSNFGAGKEYVITRVRTYSHRPSSRLYLSPSLAPSSLSSLQVSIRETFDAYNHHGLYDRSAGIESSSFASAASQLNSGSLLSITRGPCFANMSLNTASSLTALPEPAPAGLLP